ncbi:hypothetical protein EOA75_27170 [Mesorhizobium sp. M1A.F.Ca.IN.022.07.1.1]|uniref:DUF6064 family protein n=1 Tax=Mesorhizobium sp. M1A.F.Ca.IN.022.07.1.1 TaxID=2496767 RepID=UPI000FCAC96E|nr:DUF6064 family protein [Mesorhizobium sp. M1A.F.Ca.IN.022.07.1.1]RUV85678.1 hypothetical protein EOA75_27170 [Mesorhizobium sp. M1A.F.Ca.IN.022.07.1.1]TIS60985.1 MAG: hypothetical protein E5X11_11690 [Mesorhizobium sp.]
MLPFTGGQFLANLVAYNEAIWPVQLAAFAIGILAMVLLIWRPRMADRLIAAVLAVMWLWTGAAYHWLHFAEINPAAYIFAALFVVQTAVLGYAGVGKGQLSFRLYSGTAASVGISLIAYAAVLYPVLGIWTGHAYPEMPVFGVTPCPVTIVTLGFFLLAKPPVSPWLFAIPLIWSLIGGSAAFLLGMPQDWLLLMSGVIAVCLTVASRRKSRIGRSQL